MPKKILVIEKDDATLTLIETRLQVRNYEVFRAAHSDEALRLVQKMRFDLVLIGSSMEPIGGVDLPHKIRQCAAGLNVPIILLVRQDDLRELISSAQRGFDDFLITPFDPFSLQLRVSLNLSRAQERLEANPLTGLPGNAAIERNIHDRIVKGEHFSVCYLDINNFKSFNDRYGFERGDTVIRHAAQLILGSVKTSGAGPVAFVGHIGGDDFVVVLDPKFEEIFAQDCIREFDRIIPTYYDETDRKRRAVPVKSRSGVAETRPLMSIAIAIVSNQYRPYQNVGEISRDSAEVKSYLKTQLGSHYLRDRRSEPMRNIEESLSLLAKSRRREKESKPVGQMLLEVGLVTEEELSRALKRHIETKERIGQILMRMKLVTSTDLVRFLEEKLGVPYVDVKNFHLPQDLALLVGDDFIRNHQVLPLAVRAKRLELAMVDPDDHSLADMVERMCGMRVVAKLMLENEFDDFLDRHYSKSR